MTVLFVNHETEFGGAERSLIGLLGAIDRDRYSPALACTRDGPLPRSARELDVPVHFVPMAFDNRVRKTIGLWRAGAELSRLCKRESVRVVHANTLIGGYCGLRAARRSQLPLVWHVRDATYPAPARWAVRRADLVIANSHSTAASLGNARNLRVVYNGVDRRFFDQHTARRRDGLRRELDVSADSILVATVGRIDPQKGHDVLIEAAARSHTTNAVFVVVGDVLFEQSRARFGDLRAELQQEVERRGLAHRFHFLGARDDVHAILAGCDLLVHPTRLSEAFGRSIAEAQAAGLPVVASCIGGIGEIVEHGVHGFLVDPGDPGALAARIDQLCAAPDLRAELGSAGRRNASARFTMEAHARAIESIYDELL